jgi:RNA polymerase sigma-70 factor (ECF subfamily)
MTAGTKSMAGRQSSQISVSATSGAADEVLVERLLNGESSAGQVLALRHYQPLLRYLQRLSGSSHSAEELFQATWVSVLEHLDRFDPSSTSGGFRAWLFRIATNKANDLWRANGRELAAREGLRMINSQEAFRSVAPIEGSEQRDKLRDAIQRLPEAQRQVLMLRYYSDMRFVDIATVMGCPLNTALGRMHKAMLKLKTMMEES